MKNIRSQNGVGLVEVLVAVLLLSVAVLGFSALQMRAISATDESLIRTKSLTVVRSLAEVMRAYPEAYVTSSEATFTSVSPNTATAIPTIQAVITAINRIDTDPITITVDEKSISDASCLSTEVIIDPDDANKKIPKQPCNINQLAARDALIINQVAKDEEIKLAIVTCPGTTKQAIQKQMCIITAWSDTEAMLDNTDTNACADSNGIYKDGSHCLISEAY